ncbi:MAG: TlpA disulfide reductase family protein [Granulosicoccus sp.]
MRRVLANMGLTALLILTGLASAQAEGFTVATTDGVFDSTQYQGKVIYVDFWASWCAPCRKSFPWMNEVQARYADDGLVIIAVNLDKEPALVKEFLNSTPADFLIGLDPEAELAEQFAILGMPSVRVFARDGSLQIEHVGFREKDKAAYEAGIKQLLEQP